MGSFTCIFNEKTHKLFKTMFSKLFLFATFAVFVIAYADENGYQYVPNLNDSPSSFSLIEQYYLDDFLSLPDVKNHPALAILARQSESLQQTIDRQGFQPRQFGLGGLLALASSPVGSMVSLGLGATGAV